MGTLMSVEAGAQERDMATVRIPVSQLCRYCSNDKSGSFAEAEAYHSFSEASAGTFQPTRPWGATVAGDDGVADGEFQPTRPYGTRPAWSKPAGDSPRCFNPRAPRGARPPTAFPFRRRCARFNPRAPRGARPRFLQQGENHLGRFNPRAPRGARLCHNPVNGSGHKFQPTRPYGARLSIHA